MAKGAKQQAFQRLQLLGQASQKADANMLLELDHISFILKKYCPSKGLPSIPDEISELQSKLNENLSENPYLRKEFLQEACVSPQELPTNNQKNRVEVILDPSISETIAKDWIENPPEKLSRPAGTICVFENGFDLALIYATSLEQSPVKDQKTGKARILTQRINPAP